MLEGIMANQELFLDYLPFTFGIIHKKGSYLKNR